jgi:uncharacterized protein YbjT (DUF2867 family)
MKIALFGGTGMVGQGVLRACLADPEVEEVWAIGRTRLGISNPKLHEIIPADLFSLSAAENKLTGLEACFFCLGVSSVGLPEEAYARITYDLTVSVAQALIKSNPGMTFIYVSGEGTDSSEHGRSMWARVKGKTENALLQMPFKAAYMFRPGFIQPLQGIKSHTKIYRLLYAVLAPFYPLLKRVFPKFVTSTEQVGKAMLAAAKHGAGKSVLNTQDINKLAQH